MLEKCKICSKEIALNKSCIKIVIGSFSIDDFNGMPFDEHKSSYVTPWGYAHKDCMFDKIIE